MERKGECCLAPRYAQAWQMGRIMLKFRPIAPKPAAMAPVPLAPVPAAGAAKGKRKAVPGGSARRGRKPKKAATVVAAATAAPAALKIGDQKDREKGKSLSPTSSSSGITCADSSSPPPPPPATLPLMPVLSVEKEQVATAADLELSHGAGQIVAPQSLRPAAVTWVTVEAVTGTWRDGEAVPSSAAACGSVGDEAPSFVSDQWGRVTWTNTAFDKAASTGTDDDDDDASPPETARVVLAAKYPTAAVPAWGTCAGFACRVRVRHAHACPRRGPLVAPCDVWRLDAGGYLWRLDLQATLSLSLGGGLL